MYIYMHVRAINKQVAINLKESKHQCMEVLGERCNSIIILENYLKNSWETKKLKQIWRHAG